MASWRAMLAKASDRLDQSELLSRLSVSQAGFDFALHSHAGGGTVQAYRADHGGGMPLALRAAGLAALSARGATTQTGQVAFALDSRSGGIQAELAPPPRPARPRDAGAILLAGPERLFLYVSPIFSSA
jgi:hypothetical protein